MTNYQEKFSKYKPFIAPILIVCTVGITLPGMHFLSAFLGSGTLKILGVVMLALFLPNLPRILADRKACVLLLVLVGLCAYRTFHHTVYDTNLILLWTSFAWLVILTLGISNKRQVPAFSLFFLIVLSLIIFSPGLGRIFTLSREVSITEGRTGTLVGIAEHYINYAMCCLTGCFIAVSFFLVSKKPLYRWLFGAFAITAFIGCVTSGSRGAIIAMLFGVSVFLITTFRSENRKVAIKPIFIVLIVVGMVALVPWQAIWELTVVENFYRQGSTGNRWRLYRIGFEVFRDNPLIGIGWAGFSRYSVRWAQHSAWLEDFVELGLLGGVWSIILWSLLFRMCASARLQAERSGDDVLAVLLKGWMSIGVAYCAWAAFENISFTLGTRLYYVFGGVVLAAHLSLQQDRFRTQRNLAVTSDFMRTVDADRGKYRPVARISDKAPIEDSSSL